MCRALCGLHAVHAGLTQSSGAAFSQGMEALHGFLLRNPGVDLQPFLAGANDRLRTYFYEVSSCCTRL